MMEHRRLFWLLPFTIFICGLGVYGAISKPAESPVRLTEICTRNKTVIYDENGDYETDYVELTNVSGSDMDLSGFSLTDTSSNPLRYVFPEGMKLSAGESMLLWGKRSPDIRKYYREGYIPHDLGFSFSEGENCTLFDAEGNVLDSLEIPAIPEDMSFASCKMEPKEYKICLPSPGVFQEELSFPKKEILPEAPSFSIPSGFYEEELSVTLTASEGDIYYTLDGTEPNRFSSRYTSPVQIDDPSKNPNRYASVSGISVANTYLPENPLDKACILKARVITEDGKESPVAAASYFIGFSGKEGYENMSIISLILDPEDLFSEDRGIYVLGNVYRNYRDRYETLPGNEYTHEANYSREGRGWERKAKIEYFDEERKLLLSQPIGVRIHGGWSVGLAQKSFNLYARKEYDGNDCFLYDFFGQTDNKLMLRNGGRRDLFATEFRDQLPQYLASDKAFGVQQGFPCAVFLNGEYWGLYHLQEKVSESYVSNHYGIPESDSVILKIGTAGDSVINGKLQDLKDFKELIRFASENDMSDPANYRDLCGAMDIQSCIDYFCCNIYIANCDYIDNNYAVWKTRYPSENTGYKDGKWRFLSFDTDDSAGMVRGLTTSDTDSFTGGHWNGISPLSDPLFSALWKNKDFRDRFAASFRETAEENYDYERVHPLIESLASVYEDQSVMTAARFRGNYQIPDYDSERTDYATPENYRYEVKVLDDFYRTRGDYILSCLEKHLLED